MAADAGRTHGRCPRTPPFTAPCPGSGRRLAVQRRAPLTLRSECLALGNANANGTVARIHGRSAGRHCPDATSRTDAVAALSREGNDLNRAPAARETTRRGRCAVMRPVVLLRCGTRCTAAMLAAPRFNRCNRFQRTAVCCNGRLSVATDGTALQQGAMRCDRLSCAATDCARCAVTVRSELNCNRCNGRSGLRSVAKGCALLQQMALRCNRVRCAATTGCAAVCGPRCTVTFGGCTALQSLQQVAADCGLLQRAVPCCNR